MSLPSVTAFRNLRCEFTEAENKAISQALTLAIQKRDEYEEQRKRAAAEFKGLVETQEALVRRESRRFSTGFEYRNIECRVDFDTPVKGMKTIVRLDTGEIVEELAMDPEERQDSLPFEDEEETPATYGTSEVQA